jgi:DNA-binding transcriptional LysR family regulator
MRDLDLTTLRLFVHVCETGSLARASERANIVASAISKRLAQLEDQLGTALLTRKGHGLIPTTAGQTLLEHARVVFESTARIEKDMRNYAAGAHGQVRVLASGPAIAESLAADVVSFLAKPSNKAIHVDLEERMTPEIVRGVQEGHAGLGVCWDAADLGGLQHRAYCTDTFCVVVPQRHPLATRRKVHFEETLDFEHAGLPVTSASQRLMQREATRLGRSLQQRVIVATFETAVRVVRTGAVISIAPREVAQPLAAAYQLKLLPLDEPWALRRFVICFREEQALTPSARLLLDHLAAAHSVR